MVEGPDLSLFREDFLNEVNIRVATDGGFSDYAFAEVAASRLQDASEIMDFYPCHYRAPSGRLRVDGYSWDDADDSLRVFIVHRGGEEMRTLTQTEARPVFTRLTNFVSECLRGQYRDKVDENHAARDLADLIFSKKGSISRVRAYMLSDTVLSKSIKDWPDGSIDGVPVQYAIWDMGRFYRAFSSSEGLDEIEIDFTSVDPAGLPCIRASSVGDPYEAFLCAVPATFLATIYESYGSRLLEGNVRSFLTVKGKINQGIRRTLLESPEMFFAYNNGIACVATSAKVKDAADGTSIESVRNLQIVNGGQTTASIANALRFDKAKNLSQAFVPMKLSIVSGVSSERMIADISRFANSQNKVSDADFFSNHPFHQRIEQISRQLLAPARAGQQFETRWYYERARGQYLNEFVRLTDSQRQRLRLTLPKDQVVSKLDLAKSELCWAFRPHQVSAGAQVFFAEFAKRIDVEWTRDPVQFHRQFYKDIISRIIIQRCLEQLVPKQDWYIIGYRAIITSYTLAKLAYDIDKLQGKVLDLPRIWLSQAVDSALELQLLQSAQHVFALLCALPESQQNLTQLAKRQSCWEHVRASDSTLSESFTATLVRKSDAAEENAAARALQHIDSGINLQEQVVQLGCDYWYEVLAWVDHGHPVSPSDRSAIRVAAAGIPSERQCKRLLQLKKSFEDAGFIFSLKTEANP